MLTLRKHWLLFILSFLTSCSTPYGPVGDYGGFEHGGYTDQRIDQNTIVVTFRGNIATSASTANSYLLYRCAQLTKENGYDYFIITSSSNSPLNLNVHTQHLHYNNGVTFPPKLYTTYYYPDEYDGASTSTTATPGVYSQPHGAVAVIKMFQGRAPSHTPRAYQADDVLAHLGPETF